MSRKETSVHVVPEMPVFEMSAKGVSILVAQDRAERAKKGLRPSRTSSAVNPKPGETHQHRSRIVMPKEPPLSKTGTYAMRDGKLTLISRRADGVEDPSARLNADRVVMWTELPKAIHPAGKKWKKWQKCGAVAFPLIDGDSDRRKYQEVCKDVGYSRDWTK